MAAWISHPYVFAKRNHISIFELLRPPAIALFDPADSL
jgi:hypothetical protein